MENKHFDILVIDDNADNLISIEALVNNAFTNATVFLANTGQNGIDIALDILPDVILLDIVMPNMDGFEVCRKLKADPSLTEIPVVFLTAIKGNKESHIKALECGAEAFLAKPIDVSELIAQIRAMVKIREANILKRDENKRLVYLVEAKTAELIIANKKLAFQNEEKEKRAAELIIANKELAFQNEEKTNRASELVIADKKLAFQSGEKAARASELVIADKELAFQSGEKADRAAELLIANKELHFQNEEKEKRAAELIIANKELAFQNEEKDKRAAELILANKELAFQNEEKEKRAAELAVANVELAYQNEEKANRASELVIADKKLAFQSGEKAARASELVIADKELAFQSGEKADRAAELLIANKELHFQNEEKEKRAAELIIANKELAFQNEEKDKRAAELIIANKELAFQNEEKDKRAAELIVANKELAFQNEEKEKRAAELIIANKELAFQNEEKANRASELVIADKKLAFQSGEKAARASELVIADKELAFQSGEKADRAAELLIANKELLFQNAEKEKRAAELIIANKELAYQNGEKDNRAAELIVANKELAFQNEEKEKRAAELAVANVELAYQNEEKDKRAAELIIANKELAFQNEEKDKRAAELIVANKELAFQNEEKEKRAAELIIANKELAFQNEEKANRASELVIADKKLAFQSGEKAARASELVIADKELAFQSGEKADRAAELLIANKELHFQNEEKEKRAAELIIANKELAYQNGEKDNRAAELIIANNELAFQNKEKDKRAAELAVANVELAFQNEEKDKRAAELIVANKELAFQNEEKEKRAAELIVANEELAFQNEEKEKRAAELAVANVELAFQNEEKDKRAAELIIANKELAYQNEEKKRRVKLTGELKEQNIELEIEKKLLAEASQQKSSFLSNMSHEIRTPLNAIIGFTELVLKTDLTTKQYNYLSKIKTSSRSLLGLISDILDLSKIESGKLELDIAEFYLNEVVQNVINQVSIKSHEKGLDLKVLIDENVPIRLKGDSLRLGQILLNLVSNAVKFTDKGSVFIHIQLLESYENSALMHFSIKDTGIGLSQKQIEILFQPFTQANTSTTSRYGGTGLGLSIASKLSRLMEGEIGVESELGVGSTFYFTAKIDIAENERFTDFENLFQKWGRKVLVVDDESESQLIIGNMLKDMSLEATMCSSGEEAIALLQKTNDYAYGLILMDWKMPKMNGIETSKRIKRIFPLNKCPAIVIITAYNSDEVQEKANDIGLEAVLLKPISSSLMLNTIMQIIGKDDIVQYDSGIKKEGKLSDSPQLRGIRVLLVEDNEINQEVANEILSQAGLIVTIANNGQEAVAKVKENLFDIVLMDIQMPIMDGYDATREIRKSPALASLPIISMTANALLRDQQKCLEAGMNDNISKPIDTKQLFKKIAQWVLKETALPNEEFKTAEIPDNDPAKIVATSSSSDLQHLASFDFIKSLDRLGGNLEFYCRLLEKFINNHTDEIGRIRLALAVNDRKTARILAHTLKSAAGNVGALYVSEEAALLENELGEESPKDVEPLLQQLDEGLNEALSKITQYLKSATPKETNSNNEIDKSVLLPLFTRLEKSLSDYDLASNHDLEEILNMLKNSNVFDETTRIKRFVEQYDYENALKLLKNLANSLKEDGTYGK